MPDWKPQSTLPVRIVVLVAFHNATLYRPLVGSLQYLTFNRPYLTFAVNYISQFMHSPTDFHYSLVKRILCYVKSTLNLGHIRQWLGRLSPNKKIKNSFCCIPWDKCYIVNSNKQKTVSRSSTMAECQAYPAGLYIEGFENLVGGNTYSLIRQF